MPIVPILWMRSSWLVREVLFGARTRGVYKGEKVRAIAAACQRRDLHTPCGIGNRGSLSGALLFKISSVGFLLLLIWIKYFGLSQEAV
jgi:hypothetical protein